MSSAWKSWILWDPAFPGWSLRFLLTLLLGIELLKGSSESPSVVFSHSLPFGSSQLSLGKMISHFLGDLPKQGPDLVILVQLSLRCLGLYCCAIEAWLLRGSLVCNWWWWWASGFFCRDLNTKLPNVWCVVQIVELVPWLQINYPEMIEYHSSCPKQIMVSLGENLLPWDLSSRNWGYGDWEKSSVSILLEIIVRDILFYFLPLDY